MPVEDTAVDDGILREAGRVEDLQIGPTLQGHVRQFAAAHVGHEDVGKQQADRRVAVQLR